MCKRISFTLGINNQSKSYLQLDKCVRVEENGKRGVRFSAHLCEINQHNPINLIREIFI